VCVHACACACACAAARSRQVPETTKERESHLIRQWFLLDIRHPRKKGKKKTTEETTKETSEPAQLRKSAVFPQKSPESSKKS